MTYRKRHDHDKAPPPHPTPKFGSVAVAEVTDAEAEAVGVTLGSLNWADKIRPVLIGKGFPAEALFLGNPRVRSFRDDARKTTTFELLGAQ